MCIICQCMSVASNYLRFHTVFILFFFRPFFSCYFAQFVRRVSQLSLFLKKKKREFLVTHDYCSRDTFIVIVLCLFVCMFVFGGSPHFLFLLLLLFSNCYCFSCSVSIIVFFSPSTSPNPSFMLHLLFFFDVAVRILRFDITCILLNTVRALAFPLPFAFSLRKPLLILYFHTYIYVYIYIHICAHTHRLSLCAFTVGTGAKRKRQL